MLVRKRGNITGLPIKQRSHDSWARALPASGSTKSLGFLAQRRLMGLVEIAQPKSGGDFQLIWAATDAEEWIGQLGFLPF
jgi:hypothetical protein